MTIHQIHSTNYESQNTQQMTQSKNLENAGQAERTDTRQPGPEDANITTNGADRVKISREALALAQKNNSGQESRVETQQEPAQAPTEAKEDISEVL